MDNSSQIAQVQEVVQLFLATPLLFYYVTNTSIVYLVGIVPDILPLGYKA